MFRTGSDGGWAANATTTPGVEKGAVEMVKDSAGPICLLEQHSEGVVLPVRAQPGARRNEIRGEQDGALKVCVTQAPEKGKANKAIVEVLSKRLTVRKSQIELISGETSHQKRFLVRGISLPDLARRIEQAISGKD